MLKSIYIQNYALINKLDISFEKGFSVITGETGAGKSIILGALGLLLGQRADSRMVRNGASKCIIEARFDISAYNMELFFEKNELEYDANDCILRRELLSSGKSRAFINDSPTALTIIKELGENLIDIHSQHQNLLLSQTQFQLNVIDIIAENTKELTEYKKVYSTYRNTDKELKRLLEEAANNKADQDFIEFQLEQLEEASLKEGEQEELEQESTLLSNAEEIKAGFYQVEQSLDGNENGILSLLKESSHTLNVIQNVYSSAKELADRIDSCYIELKDISRELENHQERIELNPSRLSFVNERLNLIYSLQQKHRVQSEKELIEIRESYRVRLNAITSYDDQIDNLIAKKEEDYRKVQKLATELTKKRKKAILIVEQQMKERLIPLGMPNVRFIIKLSPKNEPDVSGNDHVSFLFSANKNGSLQPVSSVASGGEIARVMLSLKALIAGKAKLPTIIFDEIDTGVSGEIADKMANIMQEMGNFMQVLSITHLPQIAAKGNEHYKVYKEDDEKETNSNICQLSQEERIKEIAHMLSGATLTEAAINNAKVLLSTKC